ncbi:hypothetical protein B0H12DRAFT_1165904 [Mycena haematopus]|nr:hypothetical protein B0H12DRAFT_1165904 [Mycena haematopus]
MPAPSLPQPCPKLPPFLSLALSAPYFKSKATFKALDPKLKASEPTLVPEFPHSNRN